MADPEKRAQVEQDVASAAPEPENTMLEELLARPLERRVAMPGAPCLIADCVDAHHPTLLGRVKVRFLDAAGDEQQLWVPSLQGLAVRAADRVLLVRPGNGDEWIVTGVVDGFAARPAVDKQTAARLELKSDEALQVVSSTGQKLVEISQGQAGPRVRILEPDVQVEFAGKLAVKAETIEFEATKGEVNIKASEDVVLKGEIVRLN